LVVRNDIHGRRRAGAQHGDRHRTRVVGPSARGLAVRLRAAVRVGAVRRDRRLVGGAQLAVVSRFVGDRARRDRWRGSCRRSAPHCSH
jgi:hypothetical protein